MKRIFVLLACLGLCGCAYTGVIPMDGDTYMVGRRSLQFGAGAPVGAKAIVYQEANKFCAKQNKKVETVKCDMTNSNFGRPGSVMLQFRCVSDSASE